MRRVRPHVARMLDRLPETGAVVTDAAYHVVAWNPLAQALLGADLGDGTTNLARRRFLDQGRMYESSGAEEFGHIAVARLRRAADRYPHDPRLAALLAELHDGSEEFRQIWQTHSVHAPGHRTKTLDHPEVRQAAGELRRPARARGRPGGRPDDGRPRITRRAGPAQAGRAGNLRRSATIAGQARGWWFDRLARYGEGRGGCGRSHIQARVSV